MKIDKINNKYDMTNVISLSQELFDSLNDQKFDAGLYIVATPIGNIFDITLRALYILNNADVILAEDTRITKKLCRFYHIETMVKKYIINSKIFFLNIIDQIKCGAKIALVSDAGTPIISDPGLFLLSNCIEHKVAYYSIPGPSSVISAIAVSGVDGDRFIFGGFIHENMAKFYELIKLACAHKMPFVFFVPPHDIVCVLRDILTNVGDCQIAVAKEMTKMFETIYHCKISECLTMLLSQNKILGEYVVIIKSNA